MSQKKHVIIGAGIAGILAANLLAEQNKNVILVDSSDRFGGLLRSWMSPSNHAFDYGTHLISNTLDPVVDDIILADINDHDYKKVPILKPGTYFNHFYNSQSFNFTLEALDQNLHKKVALDMLSLPDTSNSPKNIKELTLQLFGNLAFENFISPILKKMYGDDLDSLAPSTPLLDFIGLRRLVALDSVATKRLKENSFYNDRFSFHHHEDLPPKLTNYYPYKGGMQKWLDSLLTKLKHLGVTFVTSSQVSDIKISNNHISSISLNSDNHIEVEKLIWTAPIPPLINLSGKKIQLPKLTFKKSFLHHLAFDLPIDLNNHFFMNYEPKHFSYRITIYDNLHERPKKQYHPITIEAFSEQDGQAVDHSILFKELLEIGAISANHKIIESHSIPLGLGVPFSSIEVIEYLDKAREELKSSLSNLILAGKASGETFFMHETLIDTKNKISEV